MRSLSAILLLIPSVSHAILVANNSPCGPQCGNILDRTSHDEITCTDQAYGATTYGSTFETCINCELGSSYIDPDTNKTDIGAALYNVRFALSWCLAGWDGVNNNTHVEDNQCLVSYDCGLMLDTFETNNLTLTDGPYSYCPNLLSNTVPEAKCAQCLSFTDDMKFLGNFVTILNAGCIQQPPPGTRLSIQGTPFSQTAQVNITTPTPVSLPYSDGSSGGLSLGAKIGIAVGALLFLLVLAGITIICTGRRRRRAFLAQKARLSYAGGDPAKATTFSPQTPGGMFDSPLSSQRPFANAWGYPQDVKGPPSMVSESPISPVGRQGRTPDWARDRKGPSMDGLGFEMASVSPITQPVPMLQPSSMR